jgi:hypothetical protein
MPKNDGTGPDGNGPKQINKGLPTPKKDGSGNKNGCGGRGQCGNCPKQ